jgi:hypothetical protein
MSARGEWKRQSLLVTSTLISRFLWQTASIDVFLNGECVLRTGGKFKFTGSHTSQFAQSGASHEAVLSWGAASLRSFPFQLSIDGERVLESRVYTSNWALSLLPWAIGLALLIYWTGK